MPSTMEKFKNRNKKAESIINKLKKDTKKGKKQIREFDRLDADLDFIKDKAMKTRIKSQIYWYTHHRRDKKH